MSIRPTRWESTALLAAVRHGMFIPDTRRRGRRSADHSFDKGGMVEKVPLCHRKLTKEKEAESGEFDPKWA